MFCMKISVIIPTYKPQAYLWECLDSLVTQSLSKDDFEVVLVLNGCGEPWTGEIEDYIERNMRGMNVNFIQTDVPGVSNARNVALDNARGEYIAFVDDDDFISPTYLEELLAKVSPETVSLCYPLAFVDGEQRYFPLNVTKDYERNVGKGSCDYKNARRFFSGPCRKLIHRDVIGDRRFDMRFHNGEDAIFMFLISDRFRYVSFTSKNAIYYRRIRQGSALFRKRGMRDVMGNMCRMIGTYGSIYLKAPNRYDFSFFVTRILAAIHGGVRYFLK